MQSFLLFCKVFIMVTGEFLAILVFAAAVSGQGVSFSCHKHPFLLQWLEIHMKTWLNEQLDEI